MQHTIYLHIGQQKTGSTSLQHFFSNNRKKLKKLGFEYPLPLKAGGHHYIPRFIFSESTKRDMALLNSLRKNVLTSKAENIIISAENFFNTNVDAASIKEALGNHQYKVIVYLRRYDEYCESMYKQQVKSLTTAKPWTVEEYMREMHPALGQRYQILHHYAKTFGKENVIVRTYSETQNNIYDDFLSIIGITDTRQFTPPRHYYNKSYPREVIETIRISNKTYMSIRQRKQLRRKIIKNFSKLKNFRENHFKILSPQTRFEIYQQSIEGDMKISNEFLDGKPVFPEQPNINEPWQAIDPLIIEELLKKTGIKITQD